MTNSPASAGNTDVAGRRRRTPRSVLAALLGGILPLLASLFLLTPPPAAAATLTEVTGFGNNPSNLRMHLYVPNNVAARPAVLVAVHYCTGSGPAFYSGTEFASLADRYGFIVIYPSATRSGNCFDVSSPQALRHDGGSDPVGIVSMVRYVQQRNNADPSRVYVTGASSGAMMTNVLLGDYPDVFKAGAAFAGVPFGCFATTDGSGWNSACANGTIIKTPQQWGDLARGAYPGYTGARPRMQLWHGTEDATLRYPNFGEAIKQWTNVLGVSQTPASTDRPQTNWTRTRYGATGDRAPVEAISVQGTGHSLPLAGMAARAITFFGLDTP
ncbi:MULTISPECIES: extracellular catalytic domain type 1 short-chain-length polyhydroxyalkanoate depolymerase [Streptomyces]|uniref:PHB depolymerase family esterase n=1 Tax=Streptomyces lonegramiae TaxID=3075524 RepID=A0ABU2XLY8_9ACTN|nr:PHB depolymerase family esterase [Streptomyces sp. DSM 41529]MDT0546479.1 PHB depolymerase family esterase [Streptomyces sp. DSM 41529]